MKNSSTPSSSSCRLYSAGTFKRPFSSTRVIWLPRSFIASPWLRNRCFHSVPLRRGFDLFGPLYSPFRHFLPPREPRMLHQQPSVEWKNGSVTPFPAIACGKRVLLRRKFARTQVLAVY